MGLVEICFRSNVFSSKFIVNPGQSQVQSKALAQSSLRHSLPLLKASVIVFIYFFVHHLAAALYSHLLYFLNIANLQ